MRVLIASVVLACAAGPAVAQKTQAEAEQELGIAETAGSVFWNDFYVADANAGAVHNRYDGLVTRFRAVQAQMSAADRISCSSRLSRASDNISEAEYVLGDGNFNEDSAQRWGLAGDGWIGTTADEYPQDETAYAYDNACLYDDCYNCAVSAENAYDTGEQRLTSVNVYLNAVPGDLDAAQALIEKYGG